MLREEPFATRFSGSPSRDHGMPVSLKGLDALLLFLSWFFAKKYRLIAAILKEEAKRNGLEKIFGDAVDSCECLKRCAVAAGASGGAELKEEIRRKKLQTMI